MTAPVISLDSRRRNRPPACGCARHRLETLTARSLEELATTEGELQVDRAVVARLVEDLVSTVRAALADSVGRTRP
jgi:hypothetical protein